MEPITAMLAAALGEGLYDVGKFIVEQAGPIVKEKALEKGLVEPALMPVRNVVAKLATRPQRDRALEKAFESGLAEAGAPVGDDDTALDRWLKGVSLDRLTARQNNALRRQFARAVVGFTDVSAGAPDDLIVALGWPRNQSAELAALLVTLRAQLALHPDWQALIAYANEAAKLDALNDVSAVMARLDNVFVETGAGAALRMVLEQRLGTDQAAEIEPKYRAEVVRDLRMHDFRGIVQIKRPIRLPLADIYLELALLKLGNEVERKHAQEQMLRLNEAERLAAEERRLQDRVTDVLARSPRLTILGEPGSGKTTSLRFIALMLAYGYGAARLGLDAPYIPVQMRLADYARALEARTTLSLDNFLLQAIGQQYASDHRLGEFLRLALENGACMVLLDGLDEVGDDPVRGRSLRTRVVQQVNRLADRWCEDRGNRIIVTSRIEGYWDEALSGFEHVQLSPLQPPDEVRDLLMRWYTAYEQAQDAELGYNVAVQRAQERVDEMLPRIMDWPSVRRLATNPLLLTILALIHETMGKLPNRRIKLYEIAAQTLIESWRQAQVGIPNALLAELGEETIIQIMAPLAYWLHEKRPGGTAPFEEWNERLVDILEERFEEDEAKAIAGRFLHHARYHAGLLAERGVGQFGFFHLTFEEYLAAREIARQREEKRRGMLQKHWEDPRWHEVILLAAGQLGIIESRQDDVGHYIVELLHMEPVDAENRGRQVVLAGRAMADLGLSNMKRRTRQWLQEALCETMQDRDAESKQLNDPPRIPVRTRHDAGLVLDELGWLPDDLNAWRPCDGLYAMKYPLTNAQFERFVEAKGYEERRWWSEEGWKWRTEDHNVDWRGKDPVTEPEYWRTPQYGRDRRGFPVVGISWYEAEAYANWLTDVLQRARAADSDLPEADRSLILDLLDTPAARIRLPADAEWLHMAGGDANDRYPWDPADGPATKQEEVILIRANTSESGIHSTSPVAMYPAGDSRPFELSDLAGNVWEWTDTKHERYVNSPVLRGGSWYVNLGYARCAARYGRNRDFSFDLMGCRLVSPIGS